MVHTASDFRNMRTIRKNQQRSLDIKMKKNTIIITTVFIFVFISGFMITTYAGASNNDIIMYTVKAEDTLWIIAAENISRNTDIREYIFNIKKINNLKDSLIYPGQELIIPIYN